MSADLNEIEKVISRDKDSYLFVPVISGSVLIFFFDVFDPILVYSWALCTTSALIAFTFKSADSLAEDFIIERGNNYNEDTIESISSFWEFIVLIHIAILFVCSNVILAYHLINPVADNLIYLVSLLGVLLIVGVFYSEIFSSIITAVTDFEND